MEDMGRIQGSVCVRLLHLESHKSFQLIDHGVQTLDLFVRVSDHKLVFGLLLLLLERLLGIGLALSGTRGALVQLMSLFGPMVFTIVPAQTAVRVRVRGGCRGGVVIRGG